jgi:hypothetical protein
MLLWFSLKIDKTGIITASNKLKKSRSHTYYADIRSVNTELITQLHVYNNVTRACDLMNVLIIFMINALLIQKIILIMYYIFI